MGFALLAPDILRKKLRSYVILAKQIMTYDVLSILISRENNYASCNLLFRNYQHQTSVHAHFFALRRLSNHYASYT